MSFAAEVLASAPSVTASRCHLPLAGEESPVLILPRQEKVARASASEGEVGGVLTAGVPRSAPSVTVSRGHLPLRGRIVRAATALRKLRHFHPQRPIKHPGQALAHHLSVFGADASQ